MEPNARNTRKKVDGPRITFSVQLTSTVDNLVPSLPAGESSLWYREQHQFRPGQGWGPGDPMVRPQTSAEKQVSISQMGNWTVRSSEEKKCLLLEHLHRKRLSCRQGPMVEKRSRRKMDIKMSFPWLLVSPPHPPNSQRHWQITMLRLTLFLCSPNNSRENFMY